MLATGGVDLPQVVEWLKGHVRVEADELLPECVPVGLVQVSPAWKKARMSPPSSRTLYIDQDEPRLGERLDGDSFQCYVEWWRQMTTLLPDLV